MKRKITALCLIVAMLATAIISGTLAYFTDTDTAVNVMTMGNVSIEMSEKNRDGEDFSNYKNSIQLLPAVYDGSAPADGTDEDFYWDNINNSVDKTITVKNNGKSDAYVRTWLAFEVIDGDIHYNFGDTAAANATLEWLGDNTTDTQNEWISSYTDRSELAVTVIDGISYYIARYTYLDALAPDAVTAPSLIEFALDKSITNENVTGIGNNYEILAFTQAIQAAGFSDAVTALSEFGDNHPFDGLTVNHITTVTESTSTAYFEMSSTVSTADINYAVNTAIEEGATSFVLEGQVSEDQQLALSNAITNAANQAASSMMTLRNTPAAEIVVVLNDTDTIIDELKNNPNVAYCFDKTGMIKIDANTYALGNAAGIQTWGGNGTRTAVSTDAILMADVVLPNTGATNWTALNIWNPENRPTFDGNGHTIYNLTITSGSDIGMFGACTLDLINLTISNSAITSNGRSAILIGKNYGNIENCHIVGGSITDSYWAAGAIVGMHNSGNIDNCTVTGVTVKSNGGTGGIVGVINETSGTRKVTNCKVIDCTIINTGAYGEVYGGGSVCGMVNISNSTVDFTGCEVTNTTPDTLNICGYADPDITVILP